MRFSSAVVYIDREMVRHIVEHLSLARLDMSKAIYGGDCPMCGRAKTFMLWAAKGTYRCYWCGCDGRFTRAPERVLEERRELEAKLSDSTSGGEP